MNADHQQPVVLYVEDDPHSRKLMGMLLKGRLKLTQVTMLEDARNFIETVNALDPRPTVIFLDIHVKPLNGFEMLALLRAQEWCAHVPIIALTASVMNEEVRKLEAAGFDGCLSKPIDMDTFPDILRQILAGERIWRIISH